MTRSEKKCLGFSVGMHGLLAIILLGSAAFESMPKQDNMPILNMIPAKILDNSGVGGGNPNAVETPPPQMQPQPTPPQPQAQPTPTPPRPVVQANPTPPRPVKREEPKPVERPLPDTRAELPSPKPPKKEHEIKVDYTPYDSAKSKKQKTKPKPDQSEQEASAAAAQAAAAANAKRDRAIHDALRDLQTGLEVKTSQRTVVDTKGEGGPTFADYGTVIRSIYDSKWIAPSDVANKMAEARVRIVVARDGTVLSSEIISPSGDSAVDKSVERALRAVSSLPKFPDGAQDQQRTFIIPFNLEAKESSG